MGIKGVLKPDHAPVNAFELIVLELPQITFTKVDGIEEEIEGVEMPDKTMASGGNTLPVEFTAEMPLHHTTELAALETWYNLGKGNVALGYKKNGTMIYRTISGAVAKMIPLTELWVKKRKYPDVDMSDEGKPGFVVWTFSAKVVL